MAFGGMRMFACATCCQDCVIGSDTFDGTLSAFTETGTPSVGGGLVELESGEGIVFVSAAATVNDPVRIYGMIQTEDTTATIRFKIAESDSDNYLFGEFAIASGAGTIRVGQRVGGTDEYLTDAVTVDDTDSELGELALLCLSWEPGEEQESDSFSQQSATATITGTDWTDPEDAEAQGGGFAGYAFAAAGNSTSLKYQGLSFSPPPGSTIDGIRIGVLAGDGSTIESKIKVSHMQLLDADGMAAGDVYSDSNFTDFGELVYSEHVLGDSTDDLNADLTWEDVSSPLFGFFVQLTNHDENERQGTIDIMSMTIWYTTPDRRPGVLRFSYRNTGSLTQFDCVTERSAQNPADGLKAGVQSTSGTWELTELHYEYLNSASRPSCGTCQCTVEEAEPCVCCADEFAAAATYVVDLGVGGWTDDVCGFCDTVAGEYELTATASCEWQYSEEIDCPPNAGNECYPRVLVMGLSLVSDGVNCKWRLRISSGFNCDPSQNPQFNGALYESANLASDEDCQSLPVSLTKVSEVAAGFGNDLVCGGALPSTIALEAA